MNWPSFKITTSYFIRRVEWRTYSRDAPYGSGYCHDQGQYNQLVKQWQLFGRVIWSRQIAREEVPSFVWIHEACHGSHYPGWESELEIPK